MTADSSQNSFFILVADNLTPDEAEIFSAFAFEAGASGSEESLPFVQSGAEYEPVTLEKDITTLKVYFVKPPPADFIEQMRAQFHEARFSITTEQNRDWLAEWKKGFVAFALDDDKKVWVVPSWLPIPAEANTIIRIDPGMAFGTGTHETTRLAARFLIHDQERFKGMSSGLDVGTGTGILAMLLAQIGFTNVIGNDIDDEARRVARENLAINEMPKVQIVDEDLAHIGGKYDVVVANIIDGVLLKLQDDLKKRVNPNGYLILTGILEERVERFLREFDFTGFEIVSRKQLGEWIGLLVKRTS